MHSCGAEPGVVRDISGSVGGWGLLRRRLVTDSSNAESLRAELDADLSSLHSLEAAVLTATIKISLREVPDHLLEVNLFQDWVETGQLFQGIEVIHAKQNEAEANQDLTKIGPWLIPV